MLGFTDQRMFALGFFLIYTWDWWPHVYKHTNLMIYIDKKRGPPVGRVWPGPATSL